MERTLIRKEKRSGDSLTWAAYVASSDDAGRWLYTPQGSTCRGSGASGEIGWSYVGVPEAPGVSVLHLIPAVSWWIALIKRHPSLGRSVAIDMGTPGELRDGVWVYGDLELDVQWVEGVLTLNDEDEFADACARGLISSREARSARAAAAEVHRLLQDGLAPLDESIWERLDSLDALKLPSLAHHQTAKGAV